MQIQERQTEPSSTFDGARLFAVPSNDIDEWWPSVVHHIERWVEHDGTWSTSGVRDEIRSARAQLWCLYFGEVKGVWVTRVERTPRCKWGVVWGCGGEMGELKNEAVAMFSMIEDWFRSIGCEFVEWSGREGWTRVFPEYRRHAVVMRKKL